MSENQTTRCPHCGKPVLSPAAQRDLNYMRVEAPKRGGFMWEGARPAFEAGTYHEPAISELLTIGAIAPHPDPSKGWVVTENWNV